MLTDTLGSSGRCEALEDRLGKTINKWCMHQNKRSLPLQVLQVCGQAYPPLATPGGAAAPSCSVRKRHVVPFGLGGARPEQVHLMQAIQQRILDSPSSCSSRATASL